MHQFILYGSVPLARHEQVLNILAGVSATQPTAYAEQHVLFAPKDLPPADSNAINTKRKPQLSANQQRYYNDVNRDMDYNTHAPISEWKALVKEEPEAGAPNLISQPYTMLDHVDIDKYHNSVAFKYISLQVWHGHYFVHGNVVLKIFRILLPKTDVAQPLGRIPPKKDELIVLDASGAYVVEALVKIEDRQNKKLADVASKELLDIQKLLQGSVPLTAPDRLSLDTRFKDD